MQFKFSLITDSSRYFEQRGTGLAQITSMRKTTKSPAVANSLASKDDSEIPLP
jgi:hypothetical protein